MWCGTRCALLGSGFCAADVEPAKYLNGIVVDDLAVEALGEGESQFGFAGSGGADYDDNGVGGFHWSVGQPVSGLVDRYI